MANSYDVTRLPFQQPKTQTVVNWNSCTADEILNYEEEGQEVPEQYLKWAEEMAAAMNVQDDVTYEMANGQVNEEEGGMNAAQTFRSELGDSGVSLKQQGQIFITESQDKEEQTLASIENMAPLLSQSEEINEEANAFKIDIDKSPTSEIFSKQIQKSVYNFVKNFEIHRLDKILKLFECINKLGLKVDIAEAQNMYFNKIYMKFTNLLDNVLQSNDNIEEVRDFLFSLLVLGEFLNINTEFYKSSILKLTSKQIKID